MDDLRNKYPSNSLNGPPQSANSLPNNTFYLPQPVVDQRQVTTNESRLKKYLKRKFAVSSDYLMDEFFIPMMWNSVKEIVEFVLFKGRYPKDRYYGRPYYDNPSYSGYYDYSAPYRGSSYGGRTYGRPPYDEFAEESAYNNYNNRMYNQPNPDAVDYQNIIIIDDGRRDSRGRLPIDRAYGVVQAMRDICARDGFVSVLQLLALTGHTIDPSRHFVFNDLGWTRPEEIDFKRVPRGYLILVPPATMRYMTQ